jgi:hypothetical protein
VSSSKTPQPFESIADGVRVDVGSFPAAKTLQAHALHAKRVYCITAAWAFIVAYVPTVPYACLSTCLHGPNAATYSFATPQEVQLGQPTRAGHSRSSACGID